MEGEKAILYTDDVKRLLSIWASIMCEKRDALIQLDSVVGDGDLGLTMSDGFTAAYESVAEMAETDIGKLLYRAGKAMSQAVPSTMGTLMASGLMQAGKDLKGRMALDSAEVAQLFQSFFDGVQNRGKANLGEKTFLDGLAGAVSVLKDAAENDVDPELAALEAAKRAETDCQNTKGMKAVHGRAAARGDASIELLDPGAVVASLLMNGYLTFRKSVD